MEWLRQRHECVRREAALLRVHCGDTEQRERFEMLVELRRVRRDHRFPALGDEMASTRERALRVLDVLEALDAVERCLVLQAWEAVEFCVHAVLALMDSLFRLAHELAGLVIEAFRALAEEPEPSDATSHFDGPSPALRPGRCNAVAAHARPARPRPLSVGGPLAA
jgi:hypothetical protein